MALTPEQQLSKIREKLGHLTFEWNEQIWLDTGFPDLNQVFGDPVRGIPFGRIIEINGWESVGKSALCFSLAALAQNAGAHVIWIDFENSFDEQWATKRGIDLSKLAVVRPYVGMFGSEKTPRMPNAEELCSQAEALVPILSKSGKGIVMVLDSIAAMTPKEKMNTAMEDANMRTNMALSSMLSRLFGRWVGMAQSHQVMILAINQLREKPGVYGDPVYSPGGNSLKFYCHIRVRAKRAKGGGRLMQKGKQTGIMGICRNIKNKSGGLERSEVGYKLFFSGPIQFLEAKGLGDED